MHELIQAVIDATGQREAASQMRHEDAHARACERQRAAIEALEHVLAHERELATGNATLSAANDDLTAALQERDAAIADLRDELAAERRPNVQRGREAEELRCAIEALIAEEWTAGVDPDAAETEAVVKHRIHRILDAVDARDSAAYLDAESVAAQQREQWSALKEEYDRGLDMAKRAIRLLGKPGDNLDKAVNAAVDRIAALEKESQGRLRTLNEKAVEERREWQRAEDAEAEGEKWRTLAREITGFPSVVANIRAEELDDVLRSVLRDHLAHRGESACAACEVRAASGDTHGRDHTCREDIPDRAGRAEIRAAYDAVDRMETERNEWRERKEAADKVIAQTGERLNWSGLETVWEAAERVAQERDTLRRQLASCRASERYLTEAIHQIPDLGEDEDYQVAVRRVLRERDQWRAHAEDRDRGFAAEVRRRQEAEAKLTKVAAKVNRRIAELEAAGEDEGDRQASERIIAAMKRRCACEFKDGEPVSECHRHAVERSGRRDNGDPVEWRSRPGQFGGPHEPIPVDVVRAKLVMANARIAAVEAECARVEGRPLVATEPAATAQLAALAVVDEIRAALKEAKP